MSYDVMILRGVVVVVGPWNGGSLGLRSGCMFGGLPVASPLDLAIMLLSCFVRSILAPKKLCFMEGGFLHPPVSCRTLMLYFLKSGVEGLERQTRKLHSPVAIAYGRGSHDGISHEALY